LNYNHASNQVLVETKRLLEVNGFDQSFVACQDYDTWTRLMLTFGHAKRINDISYIVHRDKELLRLTKPSNWLQGHEQYMKKHQQLMNESNIVNQLYNRLIVSQNRLGFIHLLALLPHGLKMKKLRYFVSSNIKALLQLAIGNKHDN